MVGSCTNAVTDVQTMQLRVVATHAYLAGWASGLHVFDVSNPARPVRVGTYRSDGVGEYGVDASGQYAYVTHTHSGGDDGGLDVLNVSNPSEPRRVGSCGLANLVYQVRVAGSYAYVIGYENVAGDAGRLHIIDIRDPANPVRVGGCSTPSTAQLHNLCVQGHYVFAGGYCEVHVIDVRDPANPVPIGAYETSVSTTATHSVSVAGDRLCVGGMPSLELVDISQPAQPALLAEFDFGPGLRSVCVDGSLVYASRGEGGNPTDSRIEAINVSDPIKPVLLGEYQMPSTAFRVSGNRGYLLGHSGWPSTSYLKTLDLTNPGSPVPLGSWEVTAEHSDEGLQRTLAVAGTCAYTVGNFWDDVAGDYRNHFLVFDVSDAANPLVQGRYVFDVGVGVPGPIVVVDNYAYVRSGDLGLLVMDISQKTNPALLGHSSEQLGTTALGSFGLAVAGRWAYVADHTAGLRVIDVGDPTHPTQIGLFQPKDTEIWDVQVIGRHAVVSGCSTVVAPSRGYLAVLDVSNPATPTLVADYQTKGEAVYDIEAVGNKVYVADDNWGLAIYDFVAPTVTPRLRLNTPVLSGGVVVLTWQGGGPGIKLQKTTSLAAPNWQDVPGTDGQSLAALPPSDAAAFFRLIQP